MRNRIPTRSLFALLICYVAAISAALPTGTMPISVFGDDNTTITIQLNPTIPTTSSQSSSGSVQINTQTGQIQLELEHATPNTTYTVLFLSTAANSNANVTLGGFTTDTTGHGTLEAMWATGVYVGAFQVLRTDQNVIQFASKTATIAIGTTVSVSVTQIASQTVATSVVTSYISSETRTTATTPSSTLQTEFDIEPAARSIIAGGYANYNINIRQQGVANVFLAAKGVPPKSVALFSQDSALATTDFHSTLTIVTSADTPTATYTITVVALINGQEYDTQVSLEVTSSTSISTQNSSTITASAGTSLSLTLDTDKHRYEPNATVYLHGQVTDISGNAIANANVNVQVDGPTGVEVVVLRSLQTDATGMFQGSFIIPLQTQAGTYTAFVSASKQGYIGATTRTTFVVESSSTPSVVIRAVYTGDSAGNPITVFSPGQTVYVWVVIENIGSTFQGLIWIQVRDPNGIPVQVLIRISSLTSGETLRDGFGFTLLGKPSPGVYTVNALVSDNMISQGGVFLASSNAQFAVAPS